MVKIKVYIEREGKRFSIDADSIADLFKRFDINPETVIIAKNNELVTEDARLEENDEIKFLSVISGG